MDSFSIWPILLITIPEEFFVLTICLSVSGYKDVFNFRKSGYAAKFIVTILLMTACCVIYVLNMEGSNTIKFLVLTFINLIIINVLFKHNIAKYIGGLIVSSIIIIIGESISLIILSKIFNLAANQVYHSIIYVTLLTLPTRILQIGTLYCICHFKKIHIEVKSLTKSEVLLLLPCILIILMCMYQIEYLFNIEQVKSNKETIILLINAFITILFSAFTVFRLMRIEKKLLFESYLYNFDLSRIKQLIEEGNSGYAAELIDLTLKERKYYS
ncbi:MAG: hypothetical protein N3I35_17455 [Clostridia bacterium]|nr:hypothetical protein [Clostridia bacterium]